MKRNQHKWSGKDENDGGGDDDEDDDDGDDDDDDNGGVECDPPHHSHHPIGIANRHSTTCLTEVKTALACAAVKAIA